MSFRERIAWAAFVTTVIAWGGYFSVVILRDLNGHPGHSMELLFLFIAVTIAQAVVMGAAATFFALSAPQDANARPDERDRSIAQRASATAYVAVLIAVAGVIVWLHLGLHGRATIFALIGVFILGEAVRFGSEAFGYRKAR